MTGNLPEKRSDILIYQTEDGQTRIDVCEKQKRGLMQKLLTGEIRVKT